MANCDVEAAADLASSIEHQGERLFEKDSGIFRRQGAAKTLNFAVIILLHGYSLRLSLAFQTTSVDAIAWR